jgi:RimJ/RimL family protein N-acetyltransferase
VRSAVAEDATNGWRAWYADPEVMTPLNLPTRAVSLEGLKAQIDEYDQETRLLLAIYPLGAERPIGVYMVELDHAHRTAALNVLIGDKNWWGKKAVNETRAALLDFLFDVIGTEKALGMPVTRNFPAVFNYKAQGWRLEGTLKAHARRLYGSGARLDQYLFAMRPDEWRARRAAEAEHGRD